ncbi:MAG: restriction endonuclease subunit S [Chryseolinea sp.]
MRDKIINSFDSWITAQGIKSRLRIKNVDNISLDGIARLRELILELAVRGKLVEPDPVDKLAFNMLEKIRIEKDKLIEEGKIKKQNSLLKITEEEKPFDLLSGWEWTRFGDIVHEAYTGLDKGKSFQSSDFKYPYFKMNNILNQGGFDLTELTYVDATNDEVLKYGLENDDFLFNTRNSRELVGKTCVIKGLSNQTILYNNNILRVKFFQVLPDFIDVWFRSQSGKKLLEKIKSNTTNVCAIYQGKLFDILCILPPLAMQSRIVAKVNELMSLCDDLEQQETNHLKSHQLLVETLLVTLTNAADAKEFQTAWSRLAQHFDDLFTTEDSIDQLKQTILQLAVMGKLVPQDSKDEAASVLLGKIAKEKEKLIEEGKVKNQNSLPAITKEEMPFELPKGWAWERLSNFCELITKGSSPKWQGIGYTENESDVLFVTSENVGSYKLLLDSKKYVERKFNEIEPRSILKKGDYLMNIVGGSIGRTAIYDIDQLANINQAVCLIRVLTQFFNDTFLLHFFNSEICVSYMFDKQVDNARANLSMGNISRFVIPIPPLAEQHRIVAKINELFALCDRLKEGIGESQKVVNLMANSIVEHVA